MMNGVMTSPLFIIQRSSFIILFSSFIISFFLFP